MAKGCAMRRFYLQRHEDESGVSGVGIVAEGVVFADGTVALRWVTRISSTGFYNWITDVEQIHGHGGKTEIKWVDEPPYEGA